MKNKYIQTYGQQYILDSPDNAALMAFFHEKCEQYKIMHNNDSIFEYLFQFEDGNRQMSIWDYS